MQCECGRTLASNQATTLTCRCGRSHEVEASPPQFSSGPLPGEGVGDLLEAKIPHWLKRMGCSSCQTYRQQMNWLGPDGCEREFDGIVARLVSKRPPTIPEWVARIQARKWLRDAIAEARNKNLPADSAR